MTSVRPLNVTHQRGRPVRLLVAGGAPDLLAGGLVEHDHERIALVVEHEDQLVAGEHGGHALAERHPHAQLHAEVLLPDERALEVVAVHAARPEEGVDVLAVGHGRVRGEAAVRVVPALVRHRRLRGALPEDLAGLAVEAEHVELVLHLRPAPPPGPMPRPPPGGPGGAGAGGAAACRSARLDRGRQEDEIAPHDGARVPEARDVRLPADVLGRAPGDRRVPDGHPVGGGAAPVRPVGVTRRRERPGWWLSAAPLPQSPGSHAARSALASAPPGSCRRASSTVADRMLHCALRIDRRVLHGPPSAPCASRCSTGTSSSAGRSARRTRPATTACSRRGRSRRGPRIPGRPRTPSSRRLRW